MFDPLWVEIAHSSRGYIHLNPLDSVSPIYKRSEPKFKIELRLFINLQKQSSRLILNYSLRLQLILVTQLNNFLRDY